MESESLWLLLDRVGVVFGLLAFVGTAYSAWKWWQHQRREKLLAHRIPISLVSGDDGRVLYVFPFQPPRRTVTRAEVMGLFGAIPSRVPGKRFEWAWPHRPEFMSDLERIHSGGKDSLEIPLSDREFQQLDLPANPTL